MITCVMTRKPYRALVFVLVRLHAAGWQATPADEQAPDAVLLSSTCQHSFLPFRLACCASHVCVRGVHVHPALMPSVHAAASCNVEGVFKQLWWAAKNLQAYGAGHHQLSTMSQPWHSIAQQSRCERCGSRLAKRVGWVRQ